MTLLTASLIALSLALLSVGYVLLAQWARGRL